MNKEQLMEYLNAVCDAENAIQACKDAEEICEDQLRRFPITPEPAKPVLAAPSKGKSKKSTEGMGCATAVAFFPVFIIICGLADFLGADDSAIGAIVIISLIVALYGVSALFKYMDKKDIEKETKKTTEQNQVAMEDYSVRKTEWSRIHVAEEKNRDRIRQEISALKMKHEEIQELLSKLYAKNVIYHAFRNIVAVNQIRAYLEMGICSELEGPQGAYSVYMNDVRTDKIVGSIQDMKKAVLNGLSALAQSNARLYQEMQETNQHLIEMKGAMQQEFMELGRGINNAATVRVEQLDHSLEKINHLLETSAHNQYIALRQSNVDSYLLRNP